VVPKEPEQIDFPPVSNVEVNYDVVEATRSDLISSISLFGTVQPGTRESLFFKYSNGRVTDVFVEEDQQVNRGTVLATLNVQGLEHQIELRRIALEKAQLKYQMLEAGGANRIELRMAELDVQSSSIQLADTQDRYDDNTLTAPFDGVITYIGVEEGDYAEAFQPVMTIVDLSHMIVECDPQGARDLKANAEVSVEIDQVVYTGHVTQAYEDIISLGVDALDKEKVQIEVPDMPHDIERGTSAKVTHEIARVENAIVIRRSYLHTFGDRTFVYLLKDGVKVEQDVELGLQTNSRVEVTDGLSVGDQIIVR